MCRVFEGCIVNCQSLVISTDGSHHVDEFGVPAYEERFDEVLKFHPPGLAPVRRRGIAWHIKDSGKPAYERRCERLVSTKGSRPSLTTMVGTTSMPMDGMFTVSAMRGAAMCRRGDALCASMMAHSFTSMSRAIRHTARAGSTLGTIATVWQLCKQRMDARPTSTCVLA